MIETEHAKVFHGSNLDVLPTLADNSIDAIVTDPPYELGFMGKSWDSSGIAYSVELWSECMRVLKPGGHLLAFGGSRTWHRLAVAIEDAGFEMRDSIAWLYGSGFPKSMDISKAIDKRGGQGATLTKQIGEALREAREKRGISKTQADQLFCDGSTNWTWFEGRPAGQRPPTPETFARIIDEWQELAPLAELVAEAEREVISTKTTNLTVYQNIGGDNQSGEVDITIPATPEAIKWQGWGTALKPAFEPVVVARKPFKGTVASNVLEWGVGGLNIDGSRIGMSAEDASKSANNWKPQGYDSKENIYDIGTKVIATEQSSQGRWPANIILDPYTAELLDEQSGQIKGMVGRKKEKGFRFGVGEGGEEQAFSGGVTDTGGASRFFYVAKASKRDRNEGLEELEARRASALGYEKGLGNAGEGMFKDRNPQKQNFHPTVKPTSLMRYLIKLVTPPNGTVLDPFTGSGSTGKAAILEGFNFVGIELTEDYLPIIKGRLEHAEATLNADATEQEQEQKETLF